MDALYRKRTTWADVGIAPTIKGFSRDDQAGNESWRSLSMFMHGVA